jgi:uncharacterized membrane protein
MNFYFLIAEFGTFIAFVAVLYHERKNKKMIEIMILAFVYGLIMEALNIYMSHVYTYSHDFILQILGVPLAIGAGWAIVYYLSYNAAKRFNLSWWQAPFLMALVALSFDLSLDAIAIRLGFWTWNIPLNEEWFGVPYDNFFGWLAVVWTFGLFINLSFQDFIKPRLAKIIRYAAPVISALLIGMEIMIYENSAAVLSGKFTLSQVQEFYIRQEYFYAYVPEVRTIRIYLFLSLVLFLIFLCATWINKQRKNISKSTDKFSFYLSLTAHSMFLFLLFISGIYKVSLLLPIVSFSALILAIIIELSPKFQHNH